MHGPWRNRIGFALLTALVSWSCLAYAELGRYMKDGVLFARMIDGRPHVSDFANVYNAAVLARRCLTEKVDIYSIEVQKQSLAPIIAPVVPELPFYLQYPPYFFLLMMPLAFMSTNAAWICWALAGLGSAAVSVVALAKPFSRKEKLLAVLLTLSSYPAWLSVELGQTSLLLLPILTAVVLLIEQRTFLSGCVSALAMMKLQYYPMLGLLGLAQDLINWQSRSKQARAGFFLGAVVGASVLVAASALVLGVDNLLHFPKALLGGETGSAISGVSAHAMQNVRGQLVLLFVADSTLVRQIAAGAFVLAAIAVGWFVFGVYPKLRAKRPQAALPLTSAIVILGALVFSVHAHTQDYLVATVPAILLWQYYKAAEGQRGRTIAWACLAFPFLSWFFFLLSFPLFLLRLQPFFLWAVFVLVLVVKEVRHCLSTEVTPMTTSQPRDDSQ